MAIGDVRGVLQYVPLFRGRTFVVLFDEGLLPQPAVAETLLDLKALQEIGVRLVIGVLGGDVAPWRTGRRSSRSSSRGSSRGRMLRTNVWRNVWR